MLLQIYSFFLTITLQVYTFSLLIGVIIESKSYSPENWMPYSFYKINMNLIQSPFNKIDIMYSIKVQK